MKTLIRLIALLLCLFSFELYANEILIFSADWCNPCKSLKTFVLSKPAELKGYDSVEILDIATHRELQKQLSIKVVPTSIIIGNDKKIISRKEGYNKSDYAQWLMENK